VVKEDIQVILENVKMAETLKNSDGTPYTSERKRAYVLERALVTIEMSVTELPLRVINAMIELAVVYMKGKTS
jgi:hypothetical protein